MKWWMFFVLCCFLLAGCDVTDVPEDEVFEQDEVLEEGEETAVSPPTATPIPEATTLPATATPTTIPTAVLEPTKPPTTTFYYLLSERTAEIIEVNPNRLRQMRRFSVPLPNEGNAGPEGLTFVSNEDVAQFGFFDLDASTNGGYFLVSTQAEGQIYVVDVPLEEDGGGTAVILHDFTIDGLDEDASGLTYHDGILWVAMAKKERLYAVTTDQSIEDDEIEADARYNLKDLPFDAEDIEGIVFQQESTIFLADDKGGMVSLYNDFPTCLEEETCERQWVAHIAPLEPSGLAWDAEQEQLLLVSDDGQLVAIDVAANRQRPIGLLSDDLEGMVLVRR
ncbi:MAG: hypothetical protein AAF614_33860 [Chloroflexota bacterium]